MKRENGNVMRTYKTGLKLPGSLSDPFNELVQKREVIQFLLKKHTKRFSKKQQQKLREFASKYKDLKNLKWESFIIHKNLQFSSQSTIVNYKTIFMKYLSLSQQELEILLHKNKSNIDFYKRNELIFNSNLSLKGVIKDPVNPTSTEISLSDYQNITRKYFKHLCGNSHKYALNNIKALPNDENLTERKVTALLGNGDNHLHSVSAQMATMMNVNKDMRKKLEYVRSLLRDADTNGTDFQDLLLIYLSYYSVPNHFRKYLSKVWNADSQWVRNTLVGWRRKLDPHLPQKMRVEPLTQLMAELASYCKEFCQTEDETKVIGILQKKHVLHLCNTKISLISLIPKKLINVYSKLKEKIEFSNEIKEKIDTFTSNISKDSFIRWSVKLKNKIAEEIRNLDKISVRYNRSITFLNKLNMLINHADGFKELLQNYLPGNRYTSSASKVIVYQLNREGKNTRRTKRLFTALRGVIAPAFAELYHEATAIFWEKFTPDNCITRPFTSNRKNKKYLPLELKSPKYVILRKKNPNDRQTINNEEITDVFMQNKPVWLGFKIYTPDQFLENGKLSGNTRGTLWFRLFPTKKILECILKGARIKLIRLNVPIGASNKIIADITLGAESRVPFAHASQFLKKWDEIFGTLNIPQSRYLGKDLNRLGKYMITISSITHNFDISDIMAEFHKEYEKLELYRKKIIPGLQRNLVVKNDGNRGRRETEITNIHNKRHRIMDEYNRRILMIYLYYIYKSKAQHVSWDGIEGTSNRGLRGDFAVAIQYLPNNLKQFELFKEWLEDHKMKNLISKDIEIHQVSPYTSMVCPLCYAKSKKLNKYRDKTTGYHDFRCKMCGYEGNRHSSAAMVEAISVKHAIEGIT